VTEIVDGAQGPSDEENIEPWGILDNWIAAIVLKRDERVEKENGKKDSSKGSDASLDGYVASLRQLFMSVEDPVNTLHRSEFSEEEWVMLYSGGLRGGGILSQEESIHTHTSLEVKKATESLEKASIRLAEAVRIEETEKKNLKAANERLLYGCKDDTKEAHGYAMVSFPGGEEEKNEIGSELVAMLLDHIKIVKAARNGLAGIRPYIETLKTAKELADRKVDMVEQEGFQDLIKMLHGDTPPSCPICLGTIREPVVFRCVHMACKDCLHRLIQSGTMQAQLCMLCRQPFHVKDLIRLKLPSEDEPAEVPAQQDGSKETPKNRMRLGHEPNVSPEVPPRYSEASTEALFEEFPLPHRLDLPLRALSSIPRQLVTHLRLACGGGASVPGTKEESYPLSAKLMRLVRDLRLVIAEKGIESGKSVVFSSHTRAIDHLGHVLKKEEIGYVRIVRGDSSDEVRDAVTRWNEDPQCMVFICHVGAAAAGLTLTAARHCFLLEPLSKLGEEAQAMNRCHRIGQSRQVEVTMYYYRNTVEERILAYRMMRGEPVLASAGQEEDEGEELSVLQDTASGHMSLDMFQYFLGHRHDTRPEAEVIVVE